MAEDADQEIGDVGDEKIREAYERGLEEGRREQGTTVREADEGASGSTDDMEGKVGYGSGDDSTHGPIGDVGGKGGYDPGDP